MTTSLPRRLDHLERAAASRRQSIRERVHRISGGHGVILASEIEEIVSRCARVPERIARLRASGMSAERITEQLLAEVPA